MHWPVSAEVLRPLIPEQLEIDTFEKTAWIGVVPFGMTNIHFRYLPSVPYLSTFTELNVRTYVRLRDRSGVFFFSLDAANPVAVEIARTWFYLPYFNAKMSKSSQAENIHYKSERSDSRARQCNLDTIYHPTSQQYYATTGTLEHWLTERYCFFASNKIGQIVIGEIHHKPWPLQQAEAEIRNNSLSEAIGIPLPQSKPLLHFVRKLETIEWPIIMDKYQG